MNAMKVILQNGVVGQDARLLYDGYRQSQSRNEWMNESVSQSVDHISVRIH